MPYKVFSTYKRDSGQSIVIISESAQRAFKKNVESSEIEGLMHLLLKHTIHGRSHPQIGLPVSLFEVDMNTVIVFDLYHPPLARIQDHALWFSRSLATAVHALHDMNLAHLDIRPENICVSLSTSEVILIDLDRYKINVF